MVDTGQSLMQASLVKRAVEDALRAVKEQHSRQMQSDCEARLTSCIVHMARHVPACSHSAFCALNNVSLRVCFLASP